MARDRCELSGAARARNLGDLIAGAGRTDLLGKSNQFRNQASSIKHQASSIKHQVSSIQRLVGVNAVLCEKCVGSKP
jgi:hypothetical protein